MRSSEPASLARFDFGARIDAVDAALQGLANHDPDAGPTLRALARAIAESPAVSDCALVLEAAERLETASDDQLRELAAPLVSRLREAASVRSPEFVILVIGGDPAVFAALSVALGASEHRPVFASNGAEARRLLKECQVLCVVLNVMLPDLDGRTLLAHLREVPATASVPVLLLGERLDDALKDETRLHAADDFSEQPRDTAFIAQWVRDRQRRGSATVKSARRDRLTGLLNHAALRESFARLQQECSEAREPLAFAKISVDYARTVLARLDAQTRGDALQAFGQILTHSLRTTDVVARESVYEFVALFPGEDQVGGRRAVEKIIEKNNLHPFRTAAGNTVDFAIACGVTLVMPDMALSDAISQADQFVYQAATLGGNQVVSDKTPPPAARQPRVLLLVPDLVTANVLQQLMERDHFHVGCLEQWSLAASAEIARKRYHLVVIDEQFPPTGGHDVVKALRQDPRNSRLPIIFLVAGNSETSIIKALTLGANDYLVRPFSPQAFVNRSRRLLARVAGSTPAACRILLVSDDVPMLIQMATAFQQGGDFEALLAHGPKEGIARLQSEYPSVVLIDTPIDNAAWPPLWQAMAEEATHTGLSILVAEPPAKPGATPPTYPLAVRGSLTKPFSPLKVAGEIAALLGLPAHRRPTATDAQQRLNAEIRRVTRKETNPPP